MDFLRGKLKGRNSGTGEFREGRGSSSPSTTRRWREGTSDTNRSFWSRGGAIWRRGSSQDMDVGNHERSGMSSSFSATGSRNHSVTSSEYTNETGPSYGTSLQSQRTANMSHVAEVTSPVYTSSNGCREYSRAADQGADMTSSAFTRPHRERDGAVDSLDYRVLFEKERQEKEECSQRVRELEGRQRLLERSLAKFLDLRRELKELNSQAEQADSLIDSIIQESVPEFSQKRSNSSLEEDSSYNEIRDRIKLFRGGRMELGQMINADTPTFRAQPAFADPDLPHSPTPPPLPLVSYSWEGASTTTSPLASYSRFAFSSRIPSRLDELRLNLKYDVSSSLLPTKLQLELKDKTGKVVFRKRQNLYYVKVQERLSTLDASEDYIMTVTSISGNCKASEDVRIHNKNYCTDRNRERSDTTRSFMTPGYDVTESVTLPGTACRSPSDSSITSGFDERSIDSIFDAPLRNMEASYEEVCRALSETPVPDLEEVEVVEVEAINSPPEVAADEMLAEEPRRNPFTLIKKPIVPEIAYRWQYGFRRSAGSAYQKVAILKVQFTYREAPPLLPAQLQVRCGGDVHSIAVGQGSGSTEFVLPEGGASQLEVIALDKTGEQHLTSPPFSMTSSSLISSICGQWYSEAPILKLEYGPED